MSAPRTRFRIRLPSVGSNEGAYVTRVATKTEGPQVWPLRRPTLRRGMHSSLRDLVVGYGSVFLRFPDGFHRVDEAVARIRIESLAAHDERFGDATGRQLHVLGRVAQDVVDPLRCDRVTVTEARARRDSLRCCGRRQDQGLLLVAFEVHAHLPVVARGDAVVA